MKEALGHISRDRKMRYGEMVWSSFATGSLLL
jgi:hypothetical protein